MFGHRVLLIPFDVWLSLGISFGPVENLLNDSDNKLGDMLMLKHGDRGPEYGQDTNWL
jgi:hypothetical protein